MGSVPDSNARIICGSVFEEQGVEFFFADQAAEFDESEERNERQEDEDGPAD